MSYRIFTIAYFERQLKRLLKKYPSLKAELYSLIKELDLNPNLGTPIGNDCYKVRVSIASKGKGKSGGARLITYVQFTNETVYLLSIYDKSTQENISDQEIEELKKKLRN